MLRRSELLELISLSENTTEAQEYIKAARVKAVKLAGESGHIFAQIGIDANPCASNCRYCGYAAINTSVSADNSERELDTKTIVKYSQTLADAGAELISLMTTDGFDIDKLCDIAQAVRLSIPENVKLMVNTGEIDILQARQLKESGFDSFYHTIRLGEGEITDIDPIKRRQTIKYGKEAGLNLMSGTEPLYEGQSAEQIADGILEVASFKPVISGLCALHAVEYTAMHSERPVSGERLAYLAALARLATGDDTVLGFVGNIKWINLGFDPRGRHNPTDYHGILDKFKEAKELLIKGGWVYQKEY